MAASKELKSVVMPALSERCEGCDRPSEDGAKVLDVEMRSGTRQVSRMFLCPPCRHRAAQLLLEAK